MSIRLTALLLWLAPLILLPASGFTQAGSANRQELDAQARELRESIRLLDNQKTRLGYTGADLSAKRYQLAPPRMPTGSYESQWPVDC